MTRVERVIVELPTKEGFNRRNRYIVFADGNDIRWEECFPSSKKVYDLSRRLVDRCTWKVNSSYHVRYHPHSTHV